MPKFCTPWLNVKGYDLVDREKSIGRAKLVSVLRKIASSNTSCTFHLNEFEFSFGSGLPG